MITADFHFLRPWWLLALGVLPLAWMAWRATRNDGGGWRAAIDAHLLPFLIEASTEKRRSGGTWLGVLLWGITCIALAGPAWERESIPLYRNQAARVIAIELSPTMLAADLKPTRLDRARYKINDILLASRDMQTALIGFSGDAFVAAPLTDDINTVRNLVDALDPSVMPSVGNDTARAIERAQQLIEQAGLASGELILLADSVGPRSIAAARAARAKGLTISVLGVGTSAGAPVPLPQGGFLQDAGGNIVLPRLDASALRELAAAGGGRYAGLTADGADLAALLENTTSLAGSSPADGDAATSDRFRDRGPWLVLALLPLALLAFRRGWLVAVTLVLLPVPRAEAFSFADLWQRPDQQAARALAEGNAARAQALARDPALRGSAAYRGGDFQAALDAFAGSTDGVGQYNAGNALAKLGKYEEALAAYDRALAVDPQDEDALANRKAVEDWLKRQQSEQDKDSDGEKKDGESDQQSNSEGQPKPGDSSTPQQDSASPGNPSEGEQGAGEKPSGTDPSQQGEGDQPSPSTESDGAPSPSPSEQEAAEQRAQRQQALSKGIDEALAEPGAEAMPAAPVSREEESAREQQQALNQWLQRVPDDPGGLLRRKFQLEHERRQREGDRQ